MITYVLWSRFPTVWLFADMMHSRKNDYYSCHDFFRYMQVNLVLEDAVEFSPDPNDKGKVIRKELHSEILLNGNQVAVLVPNGEGPAAELISSSS